MYLLLLALAFFLLVTVGVYFLACRQERATYFPEVRFSVSYRCLQRNDLLCSIAALVCAGVVLMVFVLALLA